MHVHTYSLFKSVVNPCITLGWLDIVTISQMPHCIATVVYKFQSERGDMHPVT